MQRLRLHGCTAAIALLFSVAVSHDAPLPAQPASEPPRAQTKDPRHAADLKHDAEQGATFAKQVLEQYKVSENAEMKERVQRIGNELARIANEYQVVVTWGDPRLNPFEYTFTVLQGDDVNAFALPGGHIFLFEGLVEFAESDDELAGVIAHEIAHASFRHIAAIQREQGRMSLVTLPLILAAIFAGGSEGATIATGISLVNQAFLSGWSVQAEESADYGGLQYMMRSPYNPVGLLTFMERLAYRERFGPRVDWGIYRTHPPTRERAQSLVTRLKQYNIPIRRSEVTRSLRARVEIAENGKLDLWFGATKLHSFAGSEAIQRADAAEKAVTAFFDRTPELFEVRLRDRTMVTGAGRKLFEVTADDLENTESTVEDLAQRAFTATQRAVYDAAYRVWRLPN